jgi:hypothetical protein
VGVATDALRDARRELERLEALLITERASAAIEGASIGAPTPKASIEALPELQGSLFDRGAT